MSRRRWLWLLGCLVWVSVPGAALAQDPGEGSQLRYIAELKQRNADYGPGCNGVGISAPRSVAMPADLGTRWVAGHSACIPGMRLVMSCLGEVASDERVIGCVLQVADGEAAGEITCERITLIAPDARFGPDPALSEALSEGSEGAAPPCSAAGAWTTGAAAAAAFVVPAAASEGDLAVLVNVDGAEVPAFLIPAGQLGGDGA